MKIRPGCAQGIGSRKEQQDSFAFSKIEDRKLTQRAGILAVLADGMGGLAMGKESSEITVKVALDIHESEPEQASFCALLQEIVVSANQKVLEMAREAGVEGDAGSTLVAAIIQNGALYWASVGDSRIYLSRNETLSQLSSDQNLETDLLKQVANGLISREKALSHPQRQALTNYIGNPELSPADANLHAFPLKNGDWVLLASDGLFGTLNDEEINQELYGDPHRTCERLVSKVMEKHKTHQDNVTVAILACGEREPVTIRPKKGGNSLNIPIFDAEKKPHWTKRKISMLVVVLILLLGGAASYWFYFKAAHELPSSLKADSKVIPAADSSQEKPESKQVIMPGEDESKETGALHPKPIDSETEQTIKENKENKQ